MGFVVLCVASAMVFIDFQLFSLSICQKVITHTYLHMRELCTVLGIFVARDQQYIN